MKNIKKKLFKYKMDTILQQNDFVFFFQYNNLKNKEWFLFKNNFYFFKKNIKNNNYDNNLLKFKNKNMYICNNNYLCKYLHNNLTFKLNKNDTIIQFFNQGPTVIVFFNNILYLNFFFNFQKNNLNKKNYNDSLLQTNLIFVGGKYKKNIVDFATIKKLCIIHENIYNNLISLYSENIKNVFNSISHLNSKLYFMLFFVFFKLYILFYMFTNLKKKLN